MGGVLSGKLKPLLSKYTYNFDQKQISIKMIQGLFQIDNLILNDIEINKQLQELKVPFKLKFGVLKKFKLKLSIIGGRLESLDVDSFIIVLGPNEELTNQKFEGEEEDVLIKTCLNNMRKNSKKAHLPADKIFGEDQKQYELYKKGEEEKQKKELERKKELQKQKEQKNDQSKNKVNIMSVEIFEIIKNLLNTDIKFENIYIVYENNLDFIDNSEKLNLQKFNLTLQLKQFYFKYDQLTKHVNKEGIFKNFINVATFLQKSGTWSASKNAYWEMDIESFQVSFATGNPFFFQKNHFLQNMSEVNMEQVIDQFQDKFERNKIQNSFDLFQMNKTTIDIIIFYKDSSKIPINAMFFNIDLSRIDFNLEIYKMELFLDVMAHFNNVSLIRQIETISPKFKILSLKKLKEFRTYNKLSSEDEKNLQQLKRMIIREYFYMSIYANYYSELLSKDIHPQLAKAMTFKKYIDESEIYKLLFGITYPNYLLQDKSQLMQKKEDIEFKKEKEKKEIEEILKDLNTKVKNDQSILMLKKIHIHLRVSCNLKLNILNRVSHRSDNALNLRGLIIDFLNPVGATKLKLMFQINELQLVASQNQFPDFRRQKLGIFKSGITTSKYSSIHQASGFTIFSISNFYLSLDLSLTPGKNDNVVIMIYSDNVLGNFEYNYYPKIFKKLVETVVELLKITKKNFRIQLASQKIQYKQWRTMEEIRKAREIVKRLKIASHKRISQKNITNSKKQIQIQEQKQKTELEKLEQEQKLEKQLKQVNSLLQNIVINLQIQTQPFVIRIFDQGFKENLVLKYQNQLIKINIDLAFKEFVSISALGVEMQSKESLPALKALVNSLQRDMKKIQEFHKKDLPL